MNTVAFDAAGRCLFVVNDELAVPDAAAVIYTGELVDANLVWYDHQNKVMRIRGPILCTVTTNKISNLPSGTTVYVGNEQVVVGDGSIEFDVAYTQQLRVVLSHVRYTDTVVEVLCEVQG